MKFESLLGKTMTSIVNDSDEELIFKTSEGEEYKLFHEYGCCEHVYIEDIVGELGDLIGEPILLAEEVMSADETPEGVTLPDYDDGSYTWTFYKLATNKGYATIRWFGSSNGNYSESVDFVRTK